MKYSECNARQKKAWNNIKYASGQYIWGLVNTALDDPDSKDWVLELFHDEDRMVNEIYHEATTTICREGYTCFNTAVVTEEMRDINFCGKEWLMERVRARVKKDLAEAIAEVESI